MARRPWPSRRGMCGALSLSRMGVGRTVAGVVQLHAPEPGSAWGAQRPRQARRHHLAFDGGRPAWGISGPFPGVPGRRSGPVAALKPTVTVISGMEAPRATPQPRVTFDSGPLCTDAADVPPITPLAGWLLERAVLARGYGLVPSPSPHNGTMVPGAVMLPSLATSTHAPLRLDGPQ